MPEAIEDLLRDVILANRVFKREDESVVFICQLEAGIILQNMRDFEYSPLPTLPAVALSIDMNTNVL